LRLCAAVGVSHCVFSTAPRNAKKACSRRSFDFSLA
jgi:hypothetical protein